MSEMCGLLFAKLNKSKKVSRIIWIALEIESNDLCPTLYLKAAGLSELSF